MRLIAAGNPVNNVFARVLRSGTTGQQQTRITPETARNSRYLVVDVQEGLQVGKAVSGTGLLHRRKLERDAVLLGKLHHQFRLKGTLDGIEEE